MMRRLRRGLTALVAVTILAVAVDGLPRQASHDRTWIRAQARLPVIRSQGDVVRISDIRDFRHPRSDVFSPP